MLIKKKNVESEAGLTLIELVISLALLIAAVVASSRLINTASRGSAEAGRRSQATFLAEREFELVKNIRDGNITAGRNAWQGLDLVDLGSASKDCIDFYMAGNGNASDPRFVKTNISTGTTRPYSSDDKLSATETDQFYSTFRRRVTMCEDVNNTPGASLYGRFDNNIRRITVTVEWDEATGPPRSVQVANSLSNWSQGL